MLRVLLTFDYVRAEGREVKARHRLRLNNKSSPRLVPALQRLGARPSSAITTLWQGCGWEDRKSGERETNKARLVD